MQTRRSVLAVAGANMFAGCSSGGAQSTAQQSEPTNETESQADDPNLTAGEIHDNWANQDIRATAETNASKAFANGREDGGIETGFYRSVESLTYGLGHFGGNPMKYHKALAGGLTVVMPDSYQVYSALEMGKSAKLVSEIPVGRYWLEQDTQDGDGEVRDVLALLDLEYKDTHVKGTTIENPSIAEEVLLNYRNPEVSITHGPHDIEAMRETMEYLRKERGKTYNEEDIEDANGSWLKEFDTMYWVDGMAVPVQDNWREYHDEFHSVHPELNRLIANTERVGEGDVAAFTIEENGPTLYTTTEDYDPEQDGMATEDELGEQI